MVGRSVWALREKEPGRRGDEPTPSRCGRTLCTSRRVGSDASRSPCPRVERLSIPLLSLAFENGSGRYSLGLHPEAGLLSRCYHPSASDGEPARHTHSEQASEETERGKVTERRSDLQRPMLIALGNGHIGHSADLPWPPRMYDRAVKQVGAEPFADKSGAASSWINHRHPSSGGSVGASYSSLRYTSRILRPTEPTMRLPATRLRRESTRRRRNAALNRSLNVVQAASFK